MQSDNETDQAQGSNISQDKVHQGVRPADDDHRMPFQCQKHDFLKKQNELMESCHMSFDEKELDSYLKNIKTRMGIKMNVMEKKMTVYQASLAGKSERETYRMNDELMKKYSEGKYKTFAVMEVDNEDLIDQFTIADYTVPFLLNIKEEFAKFETKERARTIDKAAAPENQNAQPQVPSTSTNSPGPDAESDEAPSPPLDTIQKKDQQECKERQKTFGNAVPTRFPTLLELETADPADSIETPPPKLATCSHQSSTRVNGLTLEMTLTNVKTLTANGGPFKLYTQSAVKSTSLQVATLQQLKEFGSTVTLVASPPPTPHSKEGKQDHQKQGVETESPRIIPTSSSPAPKATAAAARNCKRSSSLHAHDSAGAARIVRNSAIRSRGFINPLNRKSNDSVGPPQNPMHHPSWPRETAIRQRHPVPTCALSSLSVPIQSCPQSRYVSVPSSNPVLVVPASSGRDEIDPLSLIEPGNSLRTSTLLQTTVSLAVNVGASNTQLNSVSSNMLLIPSFQVSQTGPAQVHPNRRYKQVFHSKKPILPATATKTNDGVAEGIHHSNSNSLVTNTNMNEKIPITRSQCVSASTSTPKQSCAPAVITAISYKTNPVSFSRYTFNQTNPTSTPGPARNIVINGNANPTITAITGPLLVIPTTSSSTLNTFTTNSTSTPILSEILNNSNSNNATYTDPATEDMTEENEILGL